MYRASALGSVLSPEDGLDRSIPWHRRPWLLGSIAALLTLAVAAGAWTQTDLDQDGLDAFQERAIGTDPLLADTDGDRLPDGWEVNRGTDPLSRDTDSDGLTDDWELAQGLDPLARDTDGDTLPDPVELDQGTDPRHPDSDRDRLDDALEARLGTDPLDADTDGDGLPDSQDLLVGANPLDADTDGDGLPDLEEVLAGNLDCDGDGIPAVAEADGDNDARIDAEEPVEHRCDPDVDQDGVLDGFELNRTCVLLPDCDVDGIPDGLERTTRFDPLDPDTFDVGFLDGVSLAFEAQGQAPSRDEDHDGIPDAWESSSGLIDWGPFTPEPGRRDLLVEFVRVEGPDSARYRSLDLTPSYRQVEAFFEAQGDIEMQWQQTIVGLDQEPRPPLIPSAQAEHYRGVLRNASYAANPYVTTVVMNPQHNQSQLLHLGVAPIRGMLAAVDFGAHTTIEFRIASNDQPTELSPFLESVIAAGHEVRSQTITSSGIDDQGRMFLAGLNWTLAWHPLWFASNPVYTTEDGFQTVFVPERATVDHGELAYTIAHELGHTLGLCHTDLSSCQAGLPAESQGQLGISTMDTTTVKGAKLAFLAAEWEQVQRFLTCPPAHPVTLVSQGASRAQVIDAKYAITLENILDVGTRTCRQYDALDPDLDPATSPFTYVPDTPIEEADLLDAQAPGYQAPQEDAEAPAALNTYAATAAYAGLSALTTALAGASTWAMTWWKRGRWHG